MIYTCIELGCEWRVISTSAIRHRGPIINYLLLIGGQLSTWGSTMAQPGTEGGSWEVCNSHTSCLAPFGQSNVYKMLLGQAISGPNPPMTWLRLRFGSASVCSQHEISYPASNALPPPSALSSCSIPRYSPPFSSPFTLACCLPQFDLSLQSFGWSTLESLLNTCPRV